MQQQAGCAQQVAATLSCCVQYGIVGVATVIGVKPMPVFLVLLELHAKYCTWLLIGA
jgi:hypothetical protein